MANISVTYTFSNGTTADADEVNTNFTDIINGTSDGTKDLSISALTCAGTATFNGAVTLGNATGDDITFTGSLASSIPVKTADTYDIGTAALGLNKIYFGDNANSVSVSADAAASADWDFSFPPAEPTVGHGMQFASGGATISAPMQTNINAVSGGGYTITDTDGYRHIHVTTSTSDRTITLPTVADNTDRVITIKKVDSASGDVIVDGEGAETIDGEATFTLAQQYDAITVVSDGSSWHTLGGRSVYPGRDDGGTIQGGYIGEVIDWNTPSNQALTTSVADWTNGDIDLTAGVWMIIGQITVQMNTAGAADTNVYAQVSLTNSSNTVINGQKLTYQVDDVVSSGTLQRDICYTFPIQAVVNISASATYKIRVQKFEFTSTVTATAIADGDATFPSKLQAIRIA